MRSARRWRWTHTYGVHLLVAAIVAVVLAGSGLVVVLILGRDGDPPGDLTGPACVPGRWRVVEQQDQLSTGIFTLVGDGPVVEYRGDGTGSLDYGEGVTYTLTDTRFFNLGNTDTQVVGTVHLRYQVQPETMHHYDMRSEATFTTAIGEFTWEVNNQPFGYGCEGDSMTHEVADSSFARLQRLDS